MSALGPKITYGSLNLSHGQARDILREAYRRLFHKEPSDGELDFGLSTAFFESGYGRAGSANWAKPGQFAQWASEGLYNWGALESGIPGPERNFNKFKAAGLNPVKKLGQDAGRPSYFYLFPSDVEAAQAFLMSWGQPDTLKAAATGSPQAVAASMKNHNYYSGFWVPPGNPQNLKMPPFKEAKSAEEAQENNIRDYASALRRHVSVVTNPKTQQSSTSKMEGVARNTSGNDLIETFINKITNFLKHITASDDNSYLITITAKDLQTQLEYAKILNSVIKEELKIKSEIFTDNNDKVEIECYPDFTLPENLMVLNEISEATLNTFNYATKKLGSLDIGVLISPSEKSHYQELDIKLAEINHRMFKYKFLTLRKGK